MDAAPAVLENTLRFAQRFGIRAYASGMHEPEVLERFLRMCRDLGIEETWIEIKPVRAEIDSATVTEFVRDPALRESTLERFREVARVYQRYYPESMRITIFDEAPYGGGFARRRDWQEFEEYGPRAFAYLYGAIKEVAPQAEVGIFLNHTFNASPAMTGERAILESVVRQADELGARPDFIFSDVYRGYISRRWGMEKTNRYITDVVGNTRRVADLYGIEAHHLAQAHTIQIGYTPSRWELNETVDAVLAGRPHAVGWYWPNYASTDYRRGASRDAMGTPVGYDVSFDPFVPNAYGRVGPAGTLYGTARDRWTFAFLRVLEATGRIDPDERFDLWLYGDDFDHAEHTLYLKANASHGGAWERIGHFNPQQDRDAFYDESREELIRSYDGKEHAVVFHALDRERYLAPLEEGEHGFTMKVETAADADGSALHAVYVMPYRSTRDYETEERVTQLIQDQPRWVGVLALASHVRPRPLHLDPSRVFTHESRFSRPAQAEQDFERAWRDRVLEDRGAQRETDRSTRFDLLVYGDGFGDGDHTVFLRSGRGEWARLGTLEPAARGAAGAVAILPDLDRRRFLSDETQVRIVSADGATAGEVRAFYAVPHTGSLDSAALARIASVIEDDPDLLLAAALALNVRPTSHDLVGGGEFIDRLETPARMANIGLY